MFSGVGVVWVELQRRSISQAPSWPPLALTSRDMNTCHDLRQQQWLLSSCCVSLKTASGGVQVRGVGFCILGKQKSHVRSP